MRHRAAAVLHTPRTCPQTKGRDAPFRARCSQARPGNLFDAARHLDGWHADQARRFTEVGEYGLVLDSIAHAFLTNRMAITPQQLQAVGSLAAAMELRGDQEMQGIARLKASRRSHEP